MRKAIHPSSLNLLLLTHGLIDQARGEKKAALQRAWMDAMRHEAAEMMNLDEGRLPNTPRGAVEALLRLAMQLAKADGMSGADLTHFYNEATDSGALLDAPDMDGAVRRGFALLGVLAAHRIAAQLPDETTDERATA